jgi:hypothetical protein
MGVMVVYFSKKLVSDECGLISSTSSMFIGYLAVKESPLLENNGNWSTFKDGNTGEWSIVASFSILVGNGETLYVIMQHLLIANTKSARSLW